MFRVTDLTRSYLAQLAARVKSGLSEPATLAWYRVQLAKLDKAAGDYPAADLRVHHLVDVDLTYHFVRSVKAVYKWGADEDVQLVPRNPFRKLVGEPCGERHRILSRDEMARLYKASSPTFRRYLFVLRHTIARPGEIRGLLWGQIQWDRRVIILTKFKAKKRRRDGVKVRTIPLDRPTLRLLAGMYMRAGCPASDAPVWLDRRGRQLSANALRCRMRRVREAAGLDPQGMEERIVCYTMRHTGATNATRAGVGLKTLADIMGQSHTKTTERYLHLAGTDLVEAVDMVAARPRPRPVRTPSPAGDLGGDHPESHRPGQGT